MSRTERYQQPADPPPRLELDAARYWAGAAATTLVAALAMAVAVIIIDRVLDIGLMQPPFGDSIGWGWVAVGVISSLVAAALLHLLVLSTPRPVVFFGWIVALVTVAAAAVPFSTDRTIETKVATAATVVVLGILIGTSLPMVLDRTVRRPPPAPGYGAPDLR